MTTARPVPPRDPGYDAPAMARDVPSALASPAVRAALRDPVDGSPLRELAADHASFAGGRRYPCVDARPILIDEASSLFTIADAAALRPLTQDRAYRDRASLKNWVRQRGLPGLTRDPTHARRYAGLAALAAGHPVLVIGAGDKVERYRALFPDSVVVASDVHLQFGADCVIDAHRLPFADRFFGLVLADQVLEHTSRPWHVAAELQRVTRLGGAIHVEVPFNFPFHGVPYDFFRFTPSALRFLFADGAVLDLGVTEGGFSAAAVYLSSGVVGAFAGRRARQAALFATRLTLWWLKYLDTRERALARYISPKGLYITVRPDGATRDERTMLAEVEHLLAAP